MWRPSPKQSDTTFTILLGLAFTSLFIGQALTHIIGVLFIFALLIIRPRLPWIAPFWWMLAFIVWERASNYLGPYHGDSLKSGGIGYHFLLLFIPLCLPVINYALLLIYISVGAVTSAILIWLQGTIGIDLNAPPFRINWEGGTLFERPSGFNNRAWETQFVHSLITLVVWPYISWNKPKTWLLMAGLFTGVILPQIRAVIAGFIAALGTQMVFMRPTGSTRGTVRRIFILGVVATISISAIAILRPNFSDDLLSGNGRDKIFTASFEIFKQYPHTGLGGEKHFKKHYQHAWVDLGMHTEPPEYNETHIGHAHSDYLMLLSRYGWPGLLLWMGFVIHCVIFVWRHGNNQERVLFISLVIMHQIAGLAETYLDYSNTTYTIFLCYGLALHGPIKRYQSLSVKNE